MVPQFFKKIKPASIEDIATFLPKESLTLTVQIIQNRKIFNVSRRVKSHGNIPDTKFAEIKDEENSNWIGPLSFHPSGEYLAVAKWNFSTTIYCYDPVDKSNFTKPLLNFKDHDLTVNGVCFSQDGKLLATVGIEGRALVYYFDKDNKETFGKLKFKVDLEDNSFQCVSISPDNKFIAVGTFDSHVYIYTIVDDIVAEKVTPHKDLKAHSKEVNSLCYSICGRYIISGGMDKILVIYDLEGKVSGEGEESVSTMPQQVFTEEESILSVAINPTNDFIATGNSSGKVTIYKLLPFSTKENHFADLLMPLECHESDVNYVNFSYSGKYLASCGSDKSIHIYDADQKNVGESFGSLLRKIDVGYCLINSVAFDPIDEYLAAGSWDETIKLYS